MAQSSGNAMLEALLAELEKSFGYTSFKSDVQKRAILSIAQGIYNNKTVYCSSHVCILWLYIVCFATM